MISPPPGCTRTGRVVGVRDGRPILDDGTAIDVANVIWCTGFVPDFDWIDLPVLGEQEPNHRRGIVPDEPGLYFVGLPFLYAMSSGFLRGVSRDAEHVARHIGARFRRASRTRPTLRWDCVRGGPMTVAFDEVVTRIGDAVHQVEADGRASPVLVAVVREFQAKLAKAESLANDGEPGHDSVIELEQAGDSAKAAAEADPGLSSDARGSVLAAHLAICKLKAGA